MVQVTKTTDEQFEELIQEMEQEILEGIRAIEGLRGEWGVRLAPRRLVIGLEEEDKSIGNDCICDRVQDIS